MGQPFMILISRMGNDLLHIVTADPLALWVQRHSAFNESNSLLRSNALKL